MKMMRYLPRLVAVLVASGAPAANATQFHFVLTGGYNATFDLDTSKQPDFLGGYTFTYNNVSGTFAGTKFGSSTPATSSSAAQIQFYDAPYGGVAINGNGLNRFAGNGTQVFSGSIAAPVFLPGQYTLNDVSGFSYPTSVLTISQVAAAAVPEPATWAMMFLGLGAVGFAMRRQKVTTRVSYAG